MYPIKEIDKVKVFTGVGNTVLSSCMNISNLNFYKLQFTVRSSVVYYAAALIGVGDTMFVSSCMNLYNPNLDKVDICTRLSQIK